MLKNYYYDQITPLAKDKFKASADNFEWIINRDDSVLSPQYINHIYSFEGNYAVFKEGDKYSLLKRNGEVILEAFYDSLIYQDGFAYVKSHGHNENGWAVYDTFSIKKSKHNYQELKPRNKNLIAAKWQNKWGFINRMGEAVIPCKFDWVGAFENQLVPVIFHNEHGIIDKSGDWVVLPQKNKVEVINEAVYLSHEGSKVYLKSIQGELIYFTENELVRTGDYLMERAGDSVLWYIDLQGRIMDTGKVTGISQKDDRKISIVKKKGRFGAWDDQGNLIIPFENDYTHLMPPSEGYFGIKLDGAWGFVDYNNLLRIANRYEDILPYQEGLAGVKIMDKWGFIDKTEIVRIQPNYQHITKFKNGLSIVSKNSKWGIIDIKGKTVQKIQFDSIERLSNGMFKAYLNGKVGLLDSKGQQMINVTYNDISFGSTGYLIVSKREKFGLIQENGVAVIPTIYDQLIYDHYNQVYLGKLSSQWQSAR